MTPSPRRPFPWALLAHWARGYLVVWLLLAAIIFLVQTILAYVLHDREDVSSFLRILERMPPIFKAFIGGDQLMANNIESIVAIGYQHPLVLTMLMINAVTTPTGLITAQAERGTMEHLLARPLTRSRVYFMAAAITLVGQAALVWIVFAGTAVWTRVFDYGQEIPLGGFVEVSLNLTALACSVACLATLAAAASSERNRAIGWLVGYLVASYLLDFGAVMLPRLKALHPFSLFNYCRPLDVLRLGEFPARPIGILIAIGGAALTLGWLIWRRRDLPAA